MMQLPFRRQFSQFVLVGVPVPKLVVVLLGLTVAGAYALAKPRDVGAWISARTAEVTGTSGGLANTPGRLGSLDVMELNPALDVRNQTADLAVDLRNQVREMLVRGETPQQITAAAK